MKIYECADQLDKLLKLFNKIYSYNHNINGILLRMNSKDDINFNNLYKIYSSFYDMYYEVNRYLGDNEIESLFNDINFDYLFELINRITESTEILKSNINLTHIMKTVLNDTNIVHKIKVLLDNI